ncbi:MAG: hypothetical protein LWW75_04995 [Chlorobiales bacterium]|nr:hypothetical protein [Chlorobiales bacterium]
MDVEKEVVAWSKETFPNATFQAISDKFEEELQDCLGCCWFDGEEKCLCTSDHNGDENSCFGVCGCADFCKIEEA